MRSSLAPSANGSVDPACRGSTEHGSPQHHSQANPTQLHGNWEWEDLVDSLHFTLEAARLRAVEPYQVDQTLYARYLPALVSPTTRHPITIGMYLAELPLMALNED